MAAGTRPSFTSERLKIAASEAMTMSQAATRPLPPPMAAPFTAAIVGMGSS